MTLIPDLQRDLVDAAGRLGRRRLQAPAGVVPVGVAAAALVAVALVLVTSDGGEPSSSPAEPAAPAPPSEGPATDTPSTEPPPPSMEPVPGSASAPVEFEVDGVSYTAKGFRSDGSVICTTVQDAAGDGRLTPPLGTESCLSERILRSALADGPVHMYAGGGGGPSLDAGFARTDVANLSVIGSTDGDSRVVLSEPWRPEPWEGDPIRFVYVLSDSAPEPVPGIHRHRFRVELTNGQVVETR